MRGISKYFIGGAVVAGIAGVVWVVHDSEEKNISSVVQRIEFPQSLLRIQTMYHSEREKRLLLKELDEAIPELQAGNKNLESLAQSVNSYALAIEFDKKVRDYETVEVRVKGLAGRADADFNLVGDETGKKWALRDSKTDSRVASCDPIGQLAIDELLKRLPGHQDEGTKSQDFLGTQDISELQEILGAPQYEAIQKLQSALYKQGFFFSAGKNQSNISDKDTHVLHIATGLAMVDVGMVHLYNTNEGLALFGKTRLESKLSILANRHYTDNVNAEASQEASAYILALRTLTPNPAGVLALLASANRAIGEIDPRLAQEVSEARQYAQRTIAFKQEALQLLRIAHNEIRQFEQFCSMRRAFSQKYSTSKDW